MVMEI